MTLALLIAILLLVLAIAGLLILHVVRKTEVNVRWSATFFVADEDGEGDFRAMSGTATSEPKARSGVLDSLNAMKAESANVALVAWLVAPDQ